MAIIKMDETMKQRAQSALEETRKHLEKESAYREDLQNHAMIAFYIKHIKKLETMLQTGEWDSER
jgi:hypothetical protein